MQDDGYAYRGEQPRYPYQHQQQDSGLGIQYVRILWYDAGDFN
jgi:hypothetical protein